MADLIDQIEDARQAGRMSQSEIALELGISQGQYSKLIQRKVPLTKKLGARIQQTLEGRLASSVDLDQQILSKCIELMHLFKRKYGHESFELAVSEVAATLTSHSNDQSNL
ncbi:helix-turn-helix domain-containing protein [Gemmobacter serpentinus]|uniref:helix-turn-helix domain-containing protein n=1 Tax=Gemmobacter serpentinus TaxID=2652247 RepID=UPI00124BE490|nr:helix-turn-helix transcriptional regulator [Gemmobacter serpentinus]